VYIGVSQRIVFTVVALVCAASMAACDPPPDERPPPVPDAARLSCRSEGAVAITPTVRAQQDGVHIVFDNEADATQYYVRPTSDEHLAHGGPLDTREEEVRTTVPPGDVLVTCISSSQDASNGGERFARITVVDPEGLWIEPSLSCRDVQAGTFAGGFGGADIDVDDVIRRVVPGVTRSDELVHPGYPETPWHAELRQLVRDGEPVAQMTVFQQRGRWQVSVSRCDSYVIGEYLRRTSGAR
jgi:hypothetical protein